MSLSLAALKPSAMLSEALESPQRTAAALAQNQATQSLAWLQKKTIRHALCFARGSSDHASYLAQQMWTERYGVWAFSCPPSRTGGNCAALDFSNTLAFAVSQSGQSTDLVQAIKTARTGGAATLVLVNQANTPLAAQADQFWAIGAGQERSIAATKSFICTQVALLQMAALWHKDTATEQALQSLPETLEAAMAMDWGSAVDNLQNAHSMLIISRGATLSVAREAALKFKEVCGLHAEAISSAEFRHGPMALLSAAIPIWIIAPPGRFQNELIALARDIRSSGHAVTLIADSSVADRTLTFQTTHNAWLDPVSWVQTFYVWVSQIAIARGRNPDHPPHLSKITITQ